MTSELCMTCQSKNDLTNTSLYFQCCCGVMLSFQRGVQQLGANDLRALACMSNSSCIEDMGVQMNYA